TGMGKHIEHYHRTVTFDSVLGGAEDVLGDLGPCFASRFQSSYHPFNYRCPASNAENAQERPSMSFPPSESGPIYS
ncbi:unnamed protein product, partial [Mycena citricolor]